MASLRKICAVLAGEIALAEAVIAGLLKDHPGYQAVRRLPGTGPVLGAVIVAEIGDITRFPRPAGLCSQAGLTPATASPAPRSAAATSPSRAHGTCAGR
jgi:transposase